MTAASARFSTGIRFVRATVPLPTGVACVATAWASWFAHACELDRTYMGGIERGERNVALRNIEVIAETLGLSVSELLDGI